MKAPILLFSLLSLIACSQQPTPEDSVADAEKDSTGLIHFDLSDQTDPYEYFTIRDTDTMKYTLPENFTKPENWRKQELEKERYSNKFSDSLKLADVLAMIDTCSQFWDVCSAKSWCLQHYQEAFPHLIARLSVKEKLGLRNTADLIINCRMNTGDLKFYGHGGVIREDLFTAAGRASWILNEITGEAFVSVQGAMTREESGAYKTQWLEYMETLES